MERYLITYENGMQQVKNLIKHSIYINVIKPLLNGAYQLELNKLNKRANEIKSYLSKKYGEYFTDESPLFYAINTNILKLPHDQGGNQPIKLEKI